MRSRVAGWGRGAGRWRVMSKRHYPRPSPRLVLAAALLVVISVGYRRSLLLAGNSTKYQAQLPGRLAEGELFQCDRSQHRSDICNLKGDIRMHKYERGSKPIVLYSRNPATAHGVEIVKPYTRKWEQSCMDTVHEVTLRRVPAAPSATNPKPPACDVHHSVPGVVFSNGGYTGNLYHEFHDGLIPLFITTQHLQREVVLIISEFHTWWLTKYSEVVKQLSKFEIVNFANDTRVHCFPEVEAGLHIHEELAIDPARMPHHETIRDFRVLLDRGYTAALGTELPSATPPASMATPRRLTIIVRNGTRRFLNLDGIVITAEELGFDVTLLIPDPTTELKHIFRLLNSSDVLLGVHGAAMTHFLFMRPGTVFIQVVPLGTDWAARTYYGEPAMKLGLHYLPLKISPHESSLSEKYNSSDPILRNPDDVLQQRGWWSMKEIFLEGQDVRPSIGRIRKSLQRALEKLRGPQVQHPRPHPHPHVA